MPDNAKNSSQEYWQPVQSPRLAAAFPAVCCTSCGAEFALGARFCHVCGCDRQPDHEPDSRWEEWLDISNLRERLGLSLASLVLLVAAGACVLAAMLSGVVYKAATVLEWPAVQAWRIEWLLASSVALLAAILLKKA